MKPNSIRVPPSGPFILNGQGVNLVFGIGARLRLTEATVTCGAGNTIPTVPAIVGNVIGSGTFGVSLANPDPGLRYRATIVADVYNPTTNVLGSCELYWDASRDGATNWVEVASNSHSIGFSGTRQVRLDLPMQLGAALGVVAGDAVLALRCRIGANSNGGVVVLQSPVTPGGDVKGVGAIDAQMEECF